jgi:hypothetical protein
MMHGRWLSTLTAAATLIVGMLAVGGVVVAILAYGTAQQASDKALQGIHEIKSSRRQSIISSCEEENARHAAAKHGVEALAAGKRPPPPAGVVDGLVNAFVPTYDCAARLKAFTSVTPPNPPVTGPSSTRCTLGVMGGCVPHPALLRALPKLSGTLIPDVSEYQGCALHSEAIIRVYEAGTRREDSKALCHAQELHRLHAWTAAYAFLRPGDCSSEARTTVAIVRSLPVEVQAIVADAEVTLNAGCVSSFMATVRSSGYPAVEYTCPGCGVEHVEPIWVAAYPFRPAGRWVAHQFSSAFNCRGVSGDCSIDEGILSIHRIKPKPPAPKPSRAALLKLRAELRRDLTRRRCRVAPKHGGGKYHALCARWLRHGALVNRELRGNA